MTIESSSQAPLIIIRGMTDSSKSKVPYLRE